MKLVEFILRHGANQDEDGKFSIEVPKELIHENLMEIMPEMERYVNIKITCNGKKYCASEAKKIAKERKLNGFFKKYCNGFGLDIGHGGSPVIFTVKQSEWPENSDVDLWDINDGDAQYLGNVEDETYDFVHASHCLEHVQNCYLTLINWFRVVKKGGYLIFVVPERDLYEKKKHLPSNWNEDHKTFFKLEDHDPPCTVGVLPLIHGSLYGQDYEIVYTKVYKDGDFNPDPSAHPPMASGNFSIEAVVKKL